MAKRSSYIIKEKILHLLKESSATYAQLERKANTGYRTIKMNCEELEKFGQVSIDKIERHESNGKPSYKVSITESGKKTLHKKVKTLMS